MSSPAPLTPPPLLYCTNTLSSLPRFAIPLIPTPVPSASPRGSSLSSTLNSISDAVFCTDFHIVILSTVQPNMVTIFFATRYVVNDPTNPSFRYVSAGIRFIGSIPRSLRVMYILCPHLLHCTCNCCNLTH